MRIQACRTAVLAAVALTCIVSVGFGQTNEPAGISQQRGSGMVLRPGDVLRITVWPNPEFGGEFVIEETGYVYLPILEAVRVGGLPIDRVREELRRGYGEAMRNPVVTVTPMFSVTVTGAVQRPGVFVVTPTSTLFDVLGMAGGFHVAADPSRLRIVRPGHVVEFDARRALEVGEGLEAVQLRSGDQIVVPPARQPFNWRSILTFVQTVSLLLVTYERLRR